MSFKRNLPSVNALVTFEAAMCLRSFTAAARELKIRIVSQDEPFDRVAAAGINNTDINTRVGWYSEAVADGTGPIGADRIDDADAAWSGTLLTFPRIQGADRCGTIVAAGEGVAPERIGERVVVRNMLRTPVGYRPYECWTFGSECDGAFAQFATAPARETYRVVCSWSDEELASIPCAYSTAENMLHRAKVLPGETVLTTGASGGVGSAAVQLARRRGAAVIENLVGYIERNEIRPVVSKVYPLSSTAQAQRDFLDKGFIGKPVLTPPSEQQR